MDQIKKYNQKKNNPKDDKGKGKKIWKRQNKKYKILMKWNYHKYMCAECFS